MPYRLWRHVCRETDVQTGSPDCSVCGGRGQFVGWRLSMWEAVSVYGYVYGLRPFGPHRPLADQLLAPMRDPCVRCDGHRVLTRDDGGWAVCPACEGTGGVWNRPAEDVEAFRRAVVARWPGSVGDKS